jgi:hypothetical protein
MRDVPLVGFDEVVQLDEVDVVDAHPGQRALEAGPRTVAVARVRLGGQEELAGMLREPRREPQLRVAVHRCGVDVVDAVLEQQR